MKHVVSLLLAALALFVAGPAVAAEPPTTTFSPQPPGKVLQSTLVYLAGQAMHSQWRGVISKKLVGTSAGMSFYQLYVSIYQIDGNVYKLRYRSPGNGGPLDKVERTSDATMWFPAQDASIVGAAPLMEPGVEQLVVATHQAAADCGSADLTVFRYDSKTNRVVPAVTLQNGCSLHAKIVTPATGTAYLLLTGPYYGPHAAMCCPTKNNASATLKFVSGKWVETPNYFTLYPNRFP